MNETLHKYLTTEAVLIGGGFLWWAVGAFVPQLAQMVIPAIGIPGVFQLPDLVVVPGHLFLLGLVPVGLKTIKPGATPFKAATPVANPPKEEGL